MSNSVAPDHQLAGAWSLNKLPDLAGQYAFRVKVLTSYIYHDPALFLVDHSDGTH